MPLSPQFSRWLTKPRSPKLCLHNPLQRQVPIPSWLRWCMTNPHDNLASTTPSRRCCPPTRPSLPSTPASPTPQTTASTSATARPMCRHWWETCLKGQTARERAAWWAALPVSRPAACLAARWPDASAAAASHPEDAPCVSRLALVLLPSDNTQASLHSMQRRQTQTSANPRASKASG